MPAAVEDVAAALSRQAGDVLVNAHSMPTMTSPARRGNLNLSLINSLCVRGCIQFLAWVVTAPPGTAFELPSGAQGVGDDVSDMRVLHDLMGRAGEVCQHGMLKPGAAGSLEILVHARPGGWVSKGADGRQLAVASPHQAIATAAAEALGAGVTSTISSVGIPAAPLLVHPPCLTLGQPAALHIVVSAWQTGVTNSGGSARVLLVQGHQVVLDCIAAPATVNLSDEQHQVASGMPAGSLLYR
jgi:hypothetical protein